jgi:hypothetical protein
MAAQRYTRSLPLHRIQDPEPIPSIYRCHNQFPSTPGIHFHVILSSISWSTKDQFPKRINTCLEYLEGRKRLGHTGVDARITLELILKEKGKYVLPLIKQNCRRTTILILGFKVLTAVGMKMAVFWVVAKCSLVEILSDYTTAIFYIFLIDSKSVFFHS